MRKKEQLLWDRARSALGDECFLQRIENMLETGTPDVLAQCGETCAVLLELKSVHELPVRASTRVFGANGLSVDQANWFRAFVDAGGTAYVLGCCGPKRMWLIPGEMADDFNDMTEKELDDAAVANDWEGVLSILRGE